MSAPTIGDLAEADLIQKVVDAISLLKGIDKVSRDTQLGNSCKNNNNNKTLSLCKMLHSIINSNR
jgi:hypothetical protein